MENGAAFYGLLGAVGGALLGAAATFFTPVLQNWYADQDRRRARAEARFARLMSLRTTTRKVVVLLRAKSELVSRGITLEPEQFRSSVELAMEKAESAADALGGDGLLLYQTADTSNAVTVAGSYLFKDFMDEVLHVQDLICEAIERGPTEQSGRNLARQLDILSQRRTELVVELIDLMDGLYRRELR
ncbi:hypothetical protein GCM10010271_72020 [Streptomyces kurssanovii]|nr:hypothetical protein GCM10010271_72020 [Streptomyces kurssanovii]